MKAYKKPCISSYTINTHKLIASSQPLETPDIPTQIGGFYECSKSGCRPNSYVYNENINDWRNITRYEQTGTNKWGIPIYENVRYQYIGCYEFKSNGGDIKCQDFHGTRVCEGTQWDLYINSNDKYYVDECPSKVH